MGGGILYVYSLFIVVALFYSVLISLVYVCACIHVCVHSCVCVCVWCRLVMSTLMTSLRLPVPGLPSLPFARRDVSPLTHSLTHTLPPLTGTALIL